MNIVEALRVAEFHHAVCVVAQSEEVNGVIEAIRWRHRILPTDNNSVRIYKLPTFGIDDTLQFKAQISLKSYGTQEIFIIITQTMTREAQNALLKIFEEPSINAYIYVIIPDTTGLLPTLLSRMTCVTGTKELPKLPIKEILELAPPARVRHPLVTELIESKDKEKANEFLEAIEVYVHDNYGKEKKYLLEHIEALEKAKKYIYDQSANIKMIIEYILLMLP